MPAVTSLAIVIFTIIKDWPRSPCTGYVATDPLDAKWLRILEWPGAGRSLVRDIYGIDKLAPVTSDTGAYVLESDDSSFKRKLYRRSRSAV